MANQEQIVEGIPPQEGPQAPQEGQPPQAPQEGQQVPERPEWLPDKFQGPEDLARAYQELEQKLGQPPEEPQPQQQVDFNSIQQAITNGEEIPEAQREALKQVGIPDDFIQQWAEGQKAVVSQQTQQVLNAVGGKEAYDQMIAWAGQSLDKNEAAAYNKIMQSNDVHQVTAAVRGLQARYAAAMGNEPSLFNGRPAPASSRGFQSQGEMLQAMKDPKYKSDSAYREEVAQRVANSKFF